MEGVQPPASKQGCTCLSQHGRLMVCLQATGGHREQMISFVFVHTLQRVFMLFQVPLH